MTITTGLEDWIILTCIALVYFVSIDYMYSPNGYRYKKLQKEKEKEEEKEKYIRDSIFLKGKSRLMARYDFEKK